MLIRFSVENFLSFSERQSFSMIPGKGTLKSEHKTSKVKGISVLKTSVLFGANASGKSNLIKAIEFGKRLVIRGTKTEKSIDYQKFRLSEKSNNTDSRIEYEIQHNGKNYAYGFVFSNDLIKEEWLYEIGTNNEIKIFNNNRTTLSRAKLIFVIGVFNKLSFQGQNLFEIKKCKIKNYLSL